ESPYGPPLGEIYASWNDSASNGLPKVGAPLPAATSSNASDHLLVFTDFNMIDALPCVNPVLFLSEIAASSSSPGANFIELHNSGTAPLSLSNREIIIYVNGSEPSAFPLSGTVPAGDSWTIAADASAFQAQFGRTPNLTATNLFALNGNDVVALLDTS